MGWERVLNPQFTSLSILFRGEKWTVRDWNYTDWGATVKVDERLNEAKVDEYDALLLSGGVINPDKLRLQPKAVEFVKSFFESNKPIAAICHGPWTIMEADEARRRKIASWPSLKTDLRNTDAEWVDQEAVIDGNVVSARKPDDIPAFNRAMIDGFSPGKEQPQQKTGTERDPRHHSQNVKRMLNDVATHARLEVRDLRPQSPSPFRNHGEDSKRSHKGYDHFETTTGGLEKRQPVLGSV